MSKEAGLSFRGIDHVAIAVTNFDEAVRLWRDTLSLPLIGVEEVPSQKVKVAIFEVGAARIELVAPTSADSPVAKFLARRGDGLHHISLRVDDCEAVLRELDKRGLPLVDREAHQGAGGARVGFLHPKALGGILVEIAQRE
jgi:methylmalonyl-CoA/ethylmalonyl-CoA epimerase